MRVHLAAILIACAGAVSAQDAPDPATAPPGALACSGCHGEGSGMMLDGLTGDEIATTMRAFRDGTRDATLMNRLAAGFGDDEIAAIAAWIAGEEAAQ